MDSVFNRIVIKIITHTPKTFKTKRFCTGKYFVNRVCGASGNTFYVK